MYFVGFDAGSVAVKLVVLDSNGNKLEDRYVRHYGRALSTSLGLLQEVKGLYPESGLSLTGSAAKVLSTVLKIKYSNEIVSQSYSVQKLFPRINTIIEMGGEDSKLILLEGGQVRDFSMNSVCAAGTGSFLEQQAERLRLSIEEFSEMSVRSERPSKIAGRCSVFAKSDMIHLQQIATPMEDIVSGLCFAVARNFKSSIVKGRELRRPVAFQGGVAANKGMVRAFKEVFELDELFVPEDFFYMGALGAALKDLDESRVNNYDPEVLESYIESATFDDQGHQPLGANGTGHRKLFPSAQIVHGNGGPKSAYLGIDIGSISTNLALINDNGALIAKRYLMTAGRPIDAVRRGLDELYAEVGDGLKILGVGTTGSGRYMIADFVGADIVKNEITAQATAATFINPAVDTIFEIGGQDSKYISIRDGIIVDFEMNKACAAGTGSFLEEQAEKLGISVKEEFAGLACGSDKPCRLGERCTVFMENSLMASLQRGAAKDDLLAGLAYSIVQNYVNRVIAGKPIGKNIFFQGGVAFNKAVVAAFEKYLDREITVPPNHDVTGAIGMALIAMRHMHQPAAKDQASKFKGFSLSKCLYDVESFECKGCSNVCEINRVKIHGEKEPLFYGGRCERYDIRRSRNMSLPDPFAYRQEMLWEAHNKSSEELSEKSNAPKNRPGAARQTSRISIGIPYMFFFHDYLPFWTVFLRELGFEVIVSPRTNKQIVHLGVENVLSEACFPVKVAHGHIKYLVDSGVDALFVPSFIDMNQGGKDYPSGLACPHTQTIPYVSKAAIKGSKRITPIVDFSRGMEYLKRELHRGLKQYGVRRGDIDRAISSARTSQGRFSEALHLRGGELVQQYASGDRMAVVIVGRSYNAFDPEVNLGIPKKLSVIDTLSIPMDMLPLESVKMQDEWPNMYWRSGQRILKAARLIRNNPNFYAIYIGNFSCGPDSYILKYFKEEMGDKPFLHIEIDEHSADAGAITRCEAFLDSIAQQRLRADGGDAGNGDAATRRPVEAGKAYTVSVRRAVGASDLRKRTIYIPNMSVHTFAIEAAFERCGVKAEVLPESDKTSVDLGRKYVSGKECYPYLVTTGDMLKKVFAPDFKPGEAAFFMPSGTGPCRFGQYNISHRLVLEKLGLNDVPIFAPTQDVTFYRELRMAGGDFSMTAWKGVIAYELLTKCLHETRPYESEAGNTRLLYDDYRKKISLALRRNGKGGMEDLLKAMRSDFGAVRRRAEQRPLIGVVGEIFVRSHKFSNEDLVRKIEDLGGEVWLAPVEEWIYYVNSMSFRKALIKRRWSDMMNISLKRFFQKRVEQKYGVSFKGFLKTLEEPETREILDKASPYVHDSFEGETVLSIGKIIDLVENGAAGIINAMPFGCMPGTIVTALLKALNREYGIPSISIPYDGTESSANMLQIEAFMQTITIKNKS
ncbi:MAG: CoA protein activase [Nitrospirae bacterium]|nr:CoA protein activase [Nitrospirota bacterium]